MTRTALALSPHLDDAAFSCGGTLARLAQGGWRVVLATVFTRSVPDPQGFALACQLDKGLSAEVDYMALRRAEDRAAARALGLGEPLHLDLPEAPHRGYGSAPALFGDLSAADTVGPALGRAVRGLLDAERPDLLLAPQAIGGHVDHVQVVQALGHPAIPTLWWRDFPYVTRADTPRQPFATRMAGLPDVTVVLDGAALHAREAACLAYASQVGFQFGGGDGLRARFAASGTVERFSAGGGAEVVDLL